MSAFKTLPSKQETGTPNEISEPLAPELALRLSRELPSSSLPDLRATTSPQSVTRTDLPNPQPLRPLTPTTASLSKSRSPSNLRSQSHDGSSVSSRGSSPSIPLEDSNQGNRKIIVRSFAPRVVVYASPDTDEFIRNKGFIDGLYGLIRPYGENLQGKVIIRDSVGGSKAWDDFGIRFVNSQQLHRSSTNQSSGESLVQEARVLDNGFQHAWEHGNSLESRDQGTAIDKVLDHTLQTEDGISDGRNGKVFDYNSTPYELPPWSSPLYPIYLRKLLSSASIVPYETFSYPVACLIAVSSHHPAPIEALRQLYASTGHGSNNAPAWVGTEYLRYYVLIHDEEKADITKSTALFDLMKRHFGLHCHLLRLRSSQCVQTDDDSSRVPLCEWLSAGEEMDQVRTKDYTDEVEVFESYIFESDTTAIKALLREMVTQSILPFMENRVMTWNDQVASRRRGISGRFMSLSKRWTGFGSGKSATSGSGGTPNSSGSNYDQHGNFYPPDTPEATMRQLGDYAFMLRDWRLAYSTYDFLRSDFSHDKAWSYHAAANEMAAITSLLIPQTLGSRSRSENVDQMLDTAAYSYLTRCSMPSNVVRCLTLAIELFKNRGPIAVDDAARWAGRLLELGVLTPFTQVLTTERIADCYASRTNTTLTALGSRRRQSALWNLLASDSWIRLDKPAQARSRLRVASALYRFEDQPNAGPPFSSMRPLWQRLDHALRDADTNTPSALIDLEVNEDSPDSSTVEESEQLNAFTGPTHMNHIDAEGFTHQTAGRPDTQPLVDGFE